MARKANGEIHSLGHWEKMQIAIALHNLADSFTLSKARASEIRHTRELAALFNNDSLVTVTLEIEQS